MNALTIQGLINGLILRVLGLDTQALIQVFELELTDEEAKALCFMNPETHKEYILVTNHFKFYGSSIARLSKEFFYHYYALIQQNSCILSAKDLINKFNACLKKLKKLEFAIASSSLENKHQLIEYLQDHKLKLENRLMAIESDHKYTNLSFEQSINSLKIVDDCIFVKFIEEPQVLIGMNKVLNYQIQRSVTLNKDLYCKLKELTREYDINNVVIEGFEEANKQDLQEFSEIVEEDRIYLTELIKKTLIDTDDLEEILKIAHKMSSSLLYRLFWEKEFRLINIQ